MGVMLTLGTMIVVTEGSATSTDDDATDSTRPVVGLMMYAAWVGGTVKATAVSPGACMAHSSIRFEGLQTFSPSVCHQATQSFRTSPHPGCFLPQQGLLKLNSSAFACEMQGRICLHREGTTRHQGQVPGSCRVSRAAAIFPGAVFIMLCNAALE